MSKVFYENKLAEEISFQSFLLFVGNNSFDFIANKTISENEEKLQKAKEKASRDINNDAFWDLVFIEDELKTMAEMKIIYAYKHFETCLKFLLQSNYNVRASKLFKWEAVKDFLSTKSIETKNIKGNLEINELREVNNALKHSTISESRILPQEFKGKSNISYLDILNFYKRIEDSPIIFFKSLYSLIQQDRFEFTASRINIMASEIEKSMEPEKAIELAQNILSRYK